jgi:IclR family transcriptional regulator, KDG regulon repressor
MPRRKQADKNYIAVAGKIFAVVEYLVRARDNRDPVAFTEISKELPFARTTTHRILYSLEKLGYVEKDEVTPRYRMALKFFDLTGVSVRYRHLQSIAKPFLEKLRIYHGESANLAALDNGEIIYLDVQPSSASLRAVSDIGDRNPIHCTGLGKVMVAFAPPAEISAILDQRPLIRKTPKTITHKAHLLEHLASVREQGVALDLEENSTGVICVAAPIFNQAGQVVAACSLSGPATRMTPKLATIQDDMRATAQMITTRLRKNSI